jgi:hypothetical protein
MVEKITASVKTEYDLTESIFLLLEKIYGAIAEVTDTLTEAKNRNVNIEDGYLFHPVSDNTPDFQYLEAILLGGDNFDQSYASRGIKQLGLMKLYKTYLSKDGTHGISGSSSSTISRKSPTKSSIKTSIQGGYSSSRRRAFTVCSLKQLSNIMNNNWCVCYIYLNIYCLYSF